MLFDLSRAFFEKVRYETWDFSFFLVGSEVPLTHLGEYRVEIVVSK